MYTFMSISVVVEVGGEGLSAIKLDGQYVKNIERVFDLIAEC